MSNQSLIYSFVAKGTVVLAEHTSFSGNFNTIAIQCLQKLPSNSNKFTYSADGHTFNFLVDKGFVFLVVADEAVGRSVPFVFLERVKDDFMQQYSSSIGSEDLHPLADEDDDLFEDRFSIAYNLDREFGPRLKEHMQYCVDHPEEMSKLSKLKAQITEVKGIMMDNIEKVLDRGEKIELLVDKTANLQFQLKLLQMCWWGRSFKKAPRAFIKGMYGLALQYTEVLHDKSSPYYPIMGTTFFLVEMPATSVVYDSPYRVGAFADHNVADGFQRQGRQLRRKMWLQNLRFKLMVGCALLAFILILWLMASKGSSSASKIS